jgi:hypothetical protein
MYGIWPIYHLETVIFWKMVGQTFYLFGKDWFHVRPFLFAQLNRNFDVLTETGTYVSKLIYLYHKVLLCFPLLLNRNRFVEKQL